MFMNKFHHQGKNFFFYPLTTFLFYGDKTRQKNGKSILGREIGCCGPSYNSQIFFLLAGEWEWVREDITITVTINKNGKIYSVFVLFPSYFLSHCCCCSPFFPFKLALVDVDVGASYSVIYDNFENEKTEQKNSSLYFMLSIKFY